jgi:branched-chain amino acid transport system permease protein
MTGRPPTGEETGGLLENVLNAVAAGLIIGCLYGLMCIGLGLIFGIMKVVNFAQGELLMLGMYISLYVVGGFTAIGVLGPYVAPFVGALIAGPVLFGGGALLHRFLLTHVSGLSTAARLDQGGFGQLIVTLGVSLILQNGGLILFGSTPQAVRTPLSARAFTIGPFADDTMLFFNQARVFACVVAIVIAVALWLVMERTRLGKALRAAADNPVAATYMGIDVDRAYRIAFGLGAGITAIAGGLMATYLSFTPFVGLDYVIIMYSGVVLGGMGSILGAFWGGLLVGFVQQVSALVLSPQLQNAAIFVVFLLIVGLRPEGLFGRSAERA